MAYADLPSKVAGDTITLSDYDQIRDNFDAGVPDLAEAKGDLFVGTAADTATRLAVGSDDAILVADATPSAGVAWQIVPSARVYNDADLDPTEDAWWTLTFNQEDWDAEGCHSTVSNTSRLTVPTGGDGLYLIGANVTWDTSGYSAGGEKYNLRVRLNGTTVIMLDDQATGHYSGLDVTRILMGYYKLVATDYVELQVWTGNNVDVLALDHSPVFWWQWMRRAP